MSRIEEALRRASQIGPTPADAERSINIEPDLRLTQNHWPMLDIDEYDSEPRPAPAIPVDELVETSAGVDEAVVVTPTRSETRPETSIDGVAAPTDDQSLRRLKTMSEKLVVSEHAQPAVIEPYRKLAATLHQVQIARGTKIIMVASAIAGEGKTLTAVNLALTLSESFRRRVLLIDADLRRPMIHAVFKISNVSGLNEGLNADHEDKLSLVDVSPRLAVLPAGRPNLDPMSALTSERMRRIIKEASMKFEWVVLDTPPVGLLPDANLLGEMVDMVIFVVSAGRTPLAVVERAVKAMNRDRIVGVVLNRAVPSDTHYYQYYGAYAIRAHRRPIIDHGPVVKLVST